MAKLKKQNPSPDDQWVYRSAGMVGGVDEESRTIDLVLATETPVRTYDQERLQVVDEVLHMDGADLPGQLPMLDSHNRETTRAVIGSIRDLRVEGSRLLGRAYFASNPDAVSVFNNYRDGHLTDFSIGARRLERSYRGETMHVTRFRPLEGSAVVVGADPNAKALTVAQRSYIEPELLAREEQERMIELLRTEFQVPDDVPADDVIGWIKRNVTDKQPVESDSPQVEVDEMAERQDVTVDAEAVKRAERERVSKIQTLCRANGCSDDEITRYIDSDMDHRDVAMEILERQSKQNTAKKPVGPDPTSDDLRVGESELDKFHRAASHTLTLRALQGAGKSVNKVMAAATASGDTEAIRRSEELVAIANRPADGINTLRFMSLSDIARECLIRSGQRVDNLPRHEIVKRAMTFRADGYHTTGSFSNLLLDAANKTLLAAYDEAPGSYQVWARQAASVSDFKNINRIRFGEAPNPEEVPELQDYPEGAVTDRKETYQVAKHGQVFSISMEAVVNDDLDAISRLPAMHGAAMRRKLNKDVYSILTANAALSDNITLFHASSHGANLDANALDESALDTGFSVMMKQTGLSSDAILNITPKFLVVPAALSATANRLVNAGIVPESASNVPLYTGNGPRPLMVVSDAELDGNSATAWYLAADPMMVDTVEYTFLQGEESPVLDREEGFINDSIRYKVRQTWGTKAVDYVGLYQGNS